MNANIITADTAAANKGRTVTLILTDNTEVTGELISINSKGWNVKDADGVTVSRGLARVTMVVAEDADTDAADTDDIELDDDTDDADADDATDELDALVAELDGATTAELADVFGIAAKELRVTLRALGLGVGKGRRYHLGAEDIALVKTVLVPVATA